VGYGRSKCTEVSEAKDPQRRGKLTESPTVFSVPSKQITKFLAFFGEGGSETERLVEAIAGASNE